MPIAVLVAGIAIAAATRTGSWVPVTGSSWSPAPDQVAEARQRLKGFVEHAAKGQHLSLRDWSQYTFQYQGKVLGQQRFVFVNAFCGNQRANELQRMVIVDDGGTCYFQALYDMRKRRFVSVNFNGQA